MQVHLAVCRRTHEQCRPTHPAAEVSARVAMLPASKTAARRKQKLTGVSAGACNTVAKAVALALLGTLICALIYCSVLLSRNAGEAPLYNDPGPRATCDGSSNTGSFLRRQQPRRLRAVSKQRLPLDLSQEASQVQHPDLIGTGPRQLIPRLVDDEDSTLAALEARGKLGWVEVPDDFDWRSYLLYHPELGATGVTSKAQAEHHYVVEGGRKKLLYKKLRVILRYTACTGLVNQLYSHIAALALAARLGAEAVLPPAARRDSFAHYFSVYKDRNEVVWSPAPLDTLLDVDYLVDYWAARGLKLTRAQNLEPFPDLTEPDSAFVGLPHAGADARFTARVGDVYARHLEMEELVDAARRAVVNRAQALIAQNISADHMVLDLPCTFFMLRSASNIRLVSEIAKSLRWSGKVEALADRVVAGIAAAGDRSFNSVHLRIEKDARDWAVIMGGPEVVWASYVSAMQEAGFDGHTGLYIASGLLTYGASDELNQLVSTMRKLGLCSTAHYKELYLPKKDIEDLNSEQKALLDLLVLAKGHRFVGFGSSTFSFYLREYRALVGIPRSRSILVDASAIGTDWLFDEAGKIS